MRSDDEQVNEIEELREQLAAANALLQRWYVQRYIPGKGGPRGMLVRDTRAHLAAQPATAPAAPVEANLRAQLKAANIQIKSLERDIRELRVAVDIKTDEIERVRTILGPTAGLNES